MKPAKQILPVFAAFGYFALILEQNEKPDRELMRFYRQLTRLCKCNEIELQRRMGIINRVVKGFPEGQKIEYILLSVSIIARYYEETSRYRRYYTPMSHQVIIDLQQECMDRLEENQPDEAKEIINNSFDFADFIVEELLK